MSEQFPFHLHDRHFIVDTGQQLWLIDTGSPVSIGNEPIGYGGSVHEPASNFMGASIESLQDMVGTRFDALIGMNILGKTGFLLDTASGRFRTGVTLGDFSGHAVATKPQMGIPTVNVKMGSVNRTLFFDTGAKISYLPGNDLQSFEAVREIADFYPGLGEFTTPVYRLSLDLGNDAREIEVGCLPELLQTLLTAAGVDGILGNSAWDGGNLACCTPEHVLFFDAHSATD